jgi:hypothetical protein
MNPKPVYSHSVTWQYAQNSCPEGKIPVGDMEVSVLCLSHESNLMLCGSNSAVVPYVWQALQSTVIHTSSVVAATLVEKVPSSAHWWCWLSWLMFLMFTSTFTQVLRPYLKQVREELVACFPLIQHELHRKQKRKIRRGFTDMQTARWSHKPPIISWNISGGYADSKVIP